MRAEPDSFAFMVLVEGLLARDRRLTPVGAAILAAAHMDIAQDSRSFARELGVAHALVLRCLGALAEAGDLVRIVRRDARTLRSFYIIGAEGERLLAGHDAEALATRKSSNAA